MYRRIITVLIALALLAGVFALFPHEARAPHTQDPAAATAVQAPARETPAAPRHPAAAATHNASIASTTASRTSNAVIIVDTARYPFHAAAGMTVEDAMKHLAATTGLRFTGTVYPGLGMFIDSIDGRSGTKTEGWFLYKNGTSSGTGASQTSVAPGDTIEWRFKTI